MYFASGLGPARGWQHSVIPNVDDTMKKLTGDPKAVLLEILEPSRNIEDKYGYNIFALEDGSSSLGMIAAEDAEKSPVLQECRPRSSRSYTRADREDLLLVQRVQEASRRYAQT